MTEPLGKVRPELDPTAMQPVVHRQVAENQAAMATRLTRLTWGKVAQQSVAERSAEANRPAQVKQGLLMAEAPASRLDPPRRAFAAPVWQWSIPSRDRLGCEQRLCSCQSSRKS